MSLELSTLSPQNVLIGAGSGVLAGYAAGRATKIAVNIVKWVVVLFVGIQVTLHQMGLITIHFDEVSNLANNLFGGDKISAVVNTVTDFIFSFIPAAGGFGVGFYAGYQKMVV